MKMKRLISIVLMLSMILAASSIMFSSVSAESEAPSLKDGSTLSILEKDAAKYVTGVPERLEAADLKVNFKGNAKVFDVDGKELDDSATVRSGDSVKVNGNSVIVAVKGDVSGNGIINVTDYLQLKRYLLNTYKLEGVSAVAADIDGNGSLDTTDIISLKKHFLMTAVIGSDFTNDNLVDDPSEDGTTSDTNVSTDNDIDPTVPGKQWNKFLVVTTINKYSSASDASAMTSPIGTVSPGVYYIYNKYPNGYNGVFNITTDPTGESVGFWVNPVENTFGELYQLPTKTSQQSMCYVIKTREGKIIVIDSGNIGDGSYVLSFLKQVTGKTVPHVDAWFFTHLHGDHTNAFYTIATEYLDSITVDKFYYTFALDDEWYTSKGLSLGSVNNFRTAIAKFPNSQKITMVEGDRYVYDGFTFDVLLTMNSGFAIPTNYLNNTSTIIRMTAGAQTVLFLGDAGTEEGAFLLSKYGSALKSDFVQMAHHGQAGVEKDVYQAIAPTACLWPTPAWLYNNTNGTYKTLEVRAWMEELGVKYHFIDKDGLQTIKFPYVFESYITKTKNSVIYSFDTKEKYDEFAKDCFVSGNSFSSKAFSNSAMKLVFKASKDPYFTFNLASPLDFSEYPVIAVYSQYDLKDSSGNDYTHTSASFFTDIRPCAGTAGGSIIMREAAYADSAKAREYQKLIYDYSDGVVYKDSAYTPSGTIKSVRYDPAADALASVSTTVYIKYIGFFKTVEDAQNFAFSG